MKPGNSTLMYRLKTLRLDQVIFPASMWGLFAVIVVILYGMDSAFPAARAFVGIVLPMIAGILSAYAVLEDPALELQFSMPRPAWRLLAERLGLIFAVTAACALTYQVYLALIGLSLAPLGGAAGRQLAWLAPTLNLMGLGCLAGLAAAKPVPGAMTVGLVWFSQLIAYGWFVHHPVARYLYLYMGITHPELPELRASQLVISLLGVIFLTGAWALVRQQERYL